MDETQHEPSILMKWFGSVTPKLIPEDFEQVHAAFEYAVAEEVISEFENLEMRLKSPKIGATMTDTTAVELIPRTILFGNPDKASPQISPDGARMAYLAPVNNVLNVWVGTKRELAPLRHQPGERSTTRPDSF